MNRPTLRCAIYTRVSSDAGLEQDFNSLQAQREAAEAYIKSQAHEGWRLHRHAYDDGGFSGGSMERPALQKLLVDLADGRIDVVVVYKVDRLTRSLADFAKLVEIFDANKVSFVSVTQSFNTTSSMSRLTLNVLLSFAQFEREVTGERIRDKIAASKKKGMWMGGVVPLGYRVDKRKLLVDEVEAESVRSIFRRYLELGSLQALQRDLVDRGVRTRPRVLASGALVGGGSLSSGALAHLLKNRTYVGEINHRTASYPGEHNAIVPLEEFEAVQAGLKANLNCHNQQRNSSGALLKGCLFDGRGVPMSPSHTVKKGVRYRYYASRTPCEGSSSGKTRIERVTAAEVEAIVWKAVGAGQGTGSGNDGMADGWAARLDLRVDVGAGKLEISWTEPPRDEAENDSDPVSCSSDQIDGHDIPPQPRRRAVVAYTPEPHKRRRETIVPVDCAGSLERLRPNEHLHLLRSIATGRAWLKKIVASGTDCQAIAVREKRSERSVRMILSLAFLDPQLVRAAIHNNLPRGYGAQRLIDLPASWTQQWQTLGLTRPD